MLAAVQLIIHLAIFLLIVAYKQRCDPKNYRLDAGLLAFVVAGFNLASIGHLILIQPSHATGQEYVQLAASALLLAAVMRFKGNTAAIIDWFKRVLA